MTKITKVHYTRHALSRIEERNLEQRMVQMHIMNEKNVRKQLNRSNQSKGFVYEISVDFPAGTLIIIADIYKDEANVVTVYVKDRQQ